jgi:hypothetical protein
MIIPYPSNISNKTFFIVLKSRGNKHMVLNACNIILRILGAFR